MGSDRDRACRPQSGSVMMLVPAGVLILVILASLALDRALVLGAQRDLVATAQAAANDAVALGVDPDALRGDGRVVLDPERVRRSIERTVAGGGDGISMRFTISDDAVLVHLEREQRYLISPAVPGGPRTEVLRATARADLRRR